MLKSKIKIKEYNSVILTETHKTMTEPVACGKHSCHILIDFCISVVGLLIDYPFSISSYSVPSAMLCSEPPGFFLLMLNLLQSSQDTFYVLMNI